MAILSQPIFDQMIRAGVVPPNCRRMIIDICYDEAVKVYYDCFGDEILFEILSPMTLREAKIIAVRKQTMTSVGEGEGSVVSGDGHH